jgi:magnesium transporter
MDRNFVALRADQPQEEAVQLMLRYDRPALPVVDSRGVLVGMVTADDVADVAQQEFTEDLQKVGGMSALDESFGQASVKSLLTKRAPWLMLLFGSELLTSNTLRYFDDEMSKVIVLSTFVPAIISSGGNSGSQSSTLVIRALATGDVAIRDWWRVLRREVIVAGLLGLIIGCIGFVRVSLWGWLGLWTENKIDPVTREPIIDPETGKVMLDYSVQEHFYLLAAAISVSLFGIVLWGSIMGAMLPFVLKKCGLDPAGSSTPFVATLVDVTGIIIYVVAAMVILRGNLL